MSHEINGIIVHEVSDEPDEKGVYREDRPVSLTTMRPIMQNGNHLDTCIKTTDGWICTDTCSLEELKSMNCLKKTIDIPLRVMKSLRRTNFGRYSWSVQQEYETRTFYNGRSFRFRDRKLSVTIFGNGICWFKFRAQKKIIDCIEKNMLDAC